MRYLAICLCSILLMTAPLAAQQGSETSNNHFILGVVTISGAINGHLYLADVEAENEEDEGGICSSNVFVTYDLMLSFGIAI